MCVKLLVVSFFRTLYRSYESTGIHGLSLGAYSILELGLCHVCDNGDSESNQTLFEVVI